MANANCHRMVLTRGWLGSGPVVNWIMLNPSTADDVFDDPTIRKCIGFSRRWGASGLVVTNLFTFRATDPKDLKECARVDYARAVEQADRHLIEQAERADIVVAAWGSHGNLYGRDQDVIRRVLPEIHLTCIGFTCHGFPKHPVRAAYIDRPLEFRAGKQKG